MVGLLVASAIAYAAAAILIRAPSCGPADIECFDAVTPTAWLAAGSAVLLAPLLSFDPSKARRLAAGGLAAISLLAMAFVAYLLPRSLLLAPALAVTAAAAVHSLHPERSATSVLLLAGALAAGILAAIWALYLVAGDAEHRIRATVAAGLTLGLGILAWRTSRRHPHA